MPSVILLVVAGRSSSLYSASAIYWPSWLSYSHQARRNNSQPVVIASQQRRLVGLFFLAWYRLIKIKTHCPSGLCQLLLPVARNPI